MANKLGFSTGKGFLPKVDVAKKAETTDLTNAGWKTCSLEANLTSGTKFYEGKSYEVHFNYSGDTYVFTFSVPVGAQDIIWVGYCKHSSKEVAVCLMGRTTDGARYLEGVINDEYSLSDNATNCKYRQLN